MRNDMTRMTTGLPSLRFVAALAAGLLGAACGTSAADTIHLVDGNETVEGRIVREDARAYVVEISGGGEVRIERGRVRSIERDLRARRRGGEDTATSIEAYAAAMALDAALAGDGTAASRGDALDPARVEAAVTAANEKLETAPLAEAATFLEKVGPARIPALLPAIERLLLRASAESTESVGRRRAERAAQALLAAYFVSPKEAPSASAVDAQSRLLRAAEPEVRAESVRRLGVARDSIALLKLIDVAYGDQDPKVRAQALGVLVVAAGKDHGTADAWRAWWGTKVGATLRSAR